LKQRWSYPLVISLLAVGLLSVGVVQDWRSSRSFLHRFFCQGNWLNETQIATHLGMSLPELQAVAEREMLDYTQLCQLDRERLGEMLSEQHWGEVGAESASEPGFDQPDAALEYWLAGEKNELGEIPQGALMEAAAQAAAMKQVQAVHGPIAGLPPNGQFAAQTAGIANFRWKWIGPGNIGGRVRAILPIDANTLIIGSASGGLWKSDNAGASWYPLDDFMSSLAISTLIKDPLDSSIIYAGTGEGFLNVNSLSGAGIFKSTDQGLTWRQLSATNIFAFNYVNRLAIASDGSYLLAATSSGLWRSTDGGTTWSQRTTTRTLDVKINPQDNTRVVAGVSLMGNSGGSVSYSLDGGLTWQTAVGTGSSAGRIELAYAASSPNIVYAAVDQHPPSPAVQYSELLKSQDGGQNFTSAVSSVSNSQLNFLSAQGYYDSVLWVDPIDPNFLIIGGVQIYKTTNGGPNLAIIPGATVSIHADHHAIVSAAGYDGVTNSKVYFGNDGGVYKTDDIHQVGGASPFISLNHGLGITQFYAGSGSATNGRILGGAQDNGTSMFTNSLDWTFLYSGDDGLSAIDPSDGNYMYGQAQEGFIFRFRDGGANPASIERIYGIDVGTYSWKSAPYRIDDTMNGTINFIAPMLMDPNNPEVLLVGGASLWRTRDARNPNTTTTGPAWYAIKSPTGVNINALAVPASDSNTILVGHNNGAIYLTTNGTADAPTWTRIDNGALPTSRRLMSLAIDPSNTQVFYATFSGFNSGNIWKTTNSGATWTDISQGLPAAPIRTVAVNPTNPQWIYVGGEVGVFASEDGGLSWAAEQDGPANVMISHLFWLDSATLVAATYGRGMYRADLNGLDVHCGVNTTWYWCADAAGDDTTTRSGPVAFSSIYNPNGLELNPAQSVDTQTSYSFFLPADVSSLQWLNISFFGQDSGSGPGPELCAYNFQSQQDDCAVQGKAENTYLASLDGTPGKYFDSATHEVRLKVKDSAADSTHIKYVMVEAVIDQRILPTITPTPAVVISMYSVTIRNASYQVWSDFLPGDTIRLYYTTNNTTGAAQTVWMSVNLIGPCGSIFSAGYQNPVNNGLQNWSVTTTIPAGACGGAYTYTAAVLYNGATSSKSAPFTVSSSVTPTFTFTPQPPSATPTPRTPTPTRTRPPWLGAPSATPTPSPTSTSSQTPSETPTASFTPSLTPSATPPKTPTPSQTPSVTPTEMPTSSPTPTASPSPSLEPSETLTPSATVTASNTPTDTHTPTPVPVNHFTPTEPSLPTATHTPTPMDTPTPEPVYHFTPTETTSPTATGTSTPQPPPTSTPTATASPTSGSHHSNTSTPTPLATFTMTPSPSPTASLSPLTSHRLYLPQVSGTGRVSIASQVKKAQPKTLSETLQAFLSWLSMSVGR
jgi:photosystem II stability/assembly factor-like uncharacterized protein